MDPLLINPHTLWPLHTRTRTRTRKNCPNPAHNYTSKGPRERRGDRDEGGGGGGDAGGAERADAAARAVALQPRPRRAQDPHAARLLLPRAHGGVPRQRRRRRRKGAVLRAGEAAGRAGEGAGALLPAGGADGCGPRRPARDRLQRRGRALRRRPGRLHRRRDVQGLRALPGGASPARSLRRLRRPALPPRHGPGDLPQVRRRGGRHGHAPRHDGRRGRDPVHPDVDVRGARPGPRVRLPVPADPRPHGPPRALPSARHLRAPGLLPEQPQRPSSALRNPRLRRAAQAPRRHQVQLRPRRVHLLRGHRAPVARHVRGPRPGQGRRVQAARAGQHPAAPAPAASRELLRQRHRAGPRDRARQRRAVAATGFRGGSDQARRGAGGRCLRALRDRLPGAGVGEGQPGGARAVHAGDRPVGGELARHVHQRRRLRLGRPQVRGAGADVRQRHRVRVAGARQGRQRVRAVRARARVPALLREGLLRERVVTDADQEEHKRHLGCRVRLRLASVDVLYHKQLVNRYCGCVKAAVGCLHLSSL